MSRVTGMKKSASFLLPLIGLAIFVWIVRGTGVGNIVATFRRVDPVRLLVFPVLIAAILCVRGLRWRTLIRAAGVEYSLWRSILLFAVGFFAGAITPGKVGDALRGFYLSRETGASLGVSFSTVFIDRLMDLVTVLLFGLATVFIFSYRYTDIPSSSVVVGAVVATFALLYVALQRNLVRVLAGPFFRVVAPARYREEMSAQFHSFYDSLGAYGKRKRDTLFAVLCTVLAWAGVVSIAWACVWVLEIHVSAAYILLIMPIVTVVELIPISISGLGTREAVSIYLLSVVGVASAEAVGFSILYLMTGTYLTAMVGFVAWLFRKTSLRVGVENKKLAA